MDVRRISDIVDDLHVPGSLLILLKAILLRRSAVFESHVSDRSSLLPIMVSDQLDAILGVMSMGDQWCSLLTLVDVRVADEARSPCSCAGSSTVERTKVSSADPYGGRLISV